MSSGGTGKTSDEIVYELADSILGKLPDLLDMETASKELFKVRYGNFWKGYSPSSEVFLALKIVSHKICVPENGLSGSNRDNFLIHIHM